MKLISDLESVLQMYMYVKPCCCLKAGLCILVDFLSQRVVEEKQDIE